MPLCGGGPGGGGVGGDKVPTGTANVVGSLAHVRIFVCKKYDSKT